MDGMAELDQSLTALLWLSQLNACPLNPGHSRTNGGPQLHEGSSPFEAGPGTVSSGQIAGTEIKHAGMQGTWSGSFDGCSPTLSEESSQNEGSSPEVDQGSVTSQTPGLEERPALTYATLITLAIQSSPHRQMTIREIYQWISDQFPFYRNVGWKVHWRNSIRHNLSTNRLFVKVPRSPLDPGKGCYWMMDPTARDDLLSRPGIVSSPVVEEMQTTTAQLICKRPEQADESATITEMDLQSSGNGKLSFIDLADSFRSLYHAIFRDGDREPDDVDLPDWLQTIDNLRESFRLVSGFFWDDVDLEQIPDLMKSWKMENGGWALSETQFLDLAASLCSLKARAIEGAPLTPHSEAKQCPEFMDSNGCKVPPRPSADLSLVDLADSFRSLYNTIFRDADDDVGCEDMALPHWFKAIDNLRESFRLVSGYDFNDVDLEQIPDLMKSWKMENGGWALSETQFLDLAASLCSLKARAIEGAPLTPHSDANRFSDVLATAPTVNQRSITHVYPTCPCAPKGIGSKQSSEFCAKRSGDTSRKSVYPLPPTNQAILGCNFPPRPPNSSIPESMMDEDPDIFPWDTII